MEEGLIVVMEGRNYLVGTNDDTSDRQHEILWLKRTIGQVCMLCFCVVLESAGYLWKC